MQAINIISGITIQEKGKISESIQFTSNTVYFSHPHLDTNSGTP